MIQLAFHNLYIARLPVRHQSALHLDVTAYFRLLVEDQVLYEEVHFPVLELAGRLIQWIRAEPGNRPDFEHWSNETDEEGWVWIRRASVSVNDDDRRPFSSDFQPAWRIGSTRQAFEATQTWTFDEIAREVSKFAEALKSEIRWRYGFDVTGLLEDPKLNVLNRLS